MIIVGVLSAWTVELLPGRHKSRRHALKVSFWSDRECREPPRPVVVIRSVVGSLERRTSKRLPVAFSFTWMARR
jgi:hypothetical protein